MTRVENNRLKLSNDFEKSSTHANYVITNYFMVRHFDVRYLVRELEHDLLQPHPSVIFRYIIQKVNFVETKKLSFLVFYNFYLKIFSMC